jgi:hypothetical protein
MRLRFIPVLILLTAAGAASAQQVDFGKQVQPILDSNCIGCHKGSAAPAGLQLDSAAGVLRGGESGKVIAPSDAKNSLLVQRISDTTGNQMPPSGPLSKAEIKIITDWVDQGAKADVSPAQLSDAPRPTPTGPPPSIATVANAAQERALLDYYCVRCHSGLNAEGDMHLDKMDTAHFDKDSAKWEQVVRKMRAGMMPPSGNPRPAASAYESMIAFAETDLDRHKLTELQPSGVHRLNRTEFANVIRDLLALEIDPAKFLPSDDSTRGFDNIAGALSLSPALLEGYTAAAEKISRLALGDVSEATS